MFPACMSPWNRPWHTRLGPHLGAPPQHQLPVDPRSRIPSKSSIGMPDTRSMQMIRGPQKSQ